MKELEDAIIYLIQEKRFFAEIISRCKKTYTDQIPTLEVGITNRINLNINPEFFKSLTKRQRSEVLEHECLHLIRGHCNDRAPKHHRIWNIATDCAINQNLPELSKLEGCITLESFKKLVKKDDIKPHMESEYYYQELIEAVNDGRTKAQKIPSPIDSHEGWQKGEEEEGEGASQEMKDAMVKDLMDKSEKSTRRAGGNIPYEIEKYLSRLRSGKVNWKQQLREFFNSVTHADRRSTRTKRSRRYGTLYPGKKKNYKYNIVVAIDESGSVYDSLLETFFSEIDKLSSECADLHIMHCDTQVNSFYKYKKGMEIKRTGCGGTRYNPAFDYLKGMDIDGLIFFGDGDCFEDRINKPKFKVLWALPKHGGNPSNFGKVVRIEEEVA